MPASALIGSVAGAQCLLLNPCLLLGELKRDNVFVQEVLSFELRATIDIKTSLVFVPDFEAIIFTES